MAIKFWKKKDTQLLQWESLPQLTELAAQVLCSRGKTPDFLEEDPHEVLDQNPPLMDLDLAVQRIRTAIEEGEKVTIYGDYDCDGITSTALLYSYLEAEGADVSYYIPDRDTEGYGLNKGAIQSLKDNGIQLIITVDNGISALEEIDYANQLGVDVVVTDHHRPRETLPHAVAVVNPHRKDCPSGLTYLCGVGVVFELLSAMEGGDYELLLDQYADLVAIGTIADIVPLQGKNRIFVQRGLEQVTQHHRLGIESLLEVSGISEDTRIRAETLAFSLIPRINAAGRLGDVEASLVLLLTEDPEQAAYLAKEIDSYNKQRKEIEMKILTEIAQLLKETPTLLHKRVLVLQGKGWHHGVIGIVCARLVERYGKPCVLLSVEEEEARGSARSVEGFSMIEAITECSHLLTRFGGHPMAAGMSLKSTDVFAFAEELNAYAKEKHPIMPHAAISVDCVVDPKLLTVEQVEGLSVLEPYGEGNACPIFAVENVELEGVTPLSSGKHIKIRVKTQSQPLQFLYFGMSPERFPYQVGDRMDLAFTADINVFNNNTSVSLKIKDVRLTETPQEELCRGEKLFAMYCSEEKLTSYTQEVLPAREDAVQVYKWLRSNSVASGSEQLFYIRSQSHMGYCKFRILLEVMAELELITLGEEIALAKVTEKKDFNSSKILQRLRGE